VSLNAIAARRSSRLWTRVAAGGVAVIAAGCVVAGVAVHSHHEASSATRNVALEMPYTNGELTSALINSADLGGSFSIIDAGASGSAKSELPTTTGCFQLDAALQHQGANQQFAFRDLSHAGGAPQVWEQINAEVAARMSADYADDTAALGTCDHLSFPLPGHGFLDMTVSEADITAPGVPAVTRWLHGSIAGVQTVGFLGLAAPTSDTALIFFEFGPLGVAPSVLTRTFQDAVARAATTLTAAG